MNFDDYYSNETPAVRQYKKSMTAFRGLDPNGEVMRKAKDALWTGLHTKSLQPGDTYSNQTIATMSVQYANGAHIGDSLCPVVNVGDQPTGEYFQYTKRDRFETPDDALGDRTIPNEVEESRSSTTFSCKDYGLTNSISAKTIDAQSAPLSELVDLSESLLDVMSLKRDQRIATLLTTASNYASGNTTTLSGSDQWNGATGGNPLKDLQTARAACWTGRGPGDFVGFTSINVWNVLSRHPMLQDFFKYTGSGPLPQDVLAKWFGCRTIFVSDARKQTANEGQTASYSRIWPDYFGIVRVASTPSKRNVSFAYNFRVNGRMQTSQWFDERTGLKGRYFAKVATSDDYKIVANDAGYLIVNPLA